MASGEKTLDIAVNSSESVLPIEWIVEGDMLEMFKMVVKLTDANGKVLCENDHSLLIDDHATAKATLKERHIAHGPAR